MLFFYRTMLITLVGMAIANPVFAINVAPPQTQAEINHSAPLTAPKREGREAVQPHALKININQATEKELIRVRGLNASKAKAIVRYRKKHGDFKEIDALAKVRGFTRMKEDDLQHIKDQLSIN